MIDPEDLLTHYGDDVTGYLAEDGTIDPAKIGLALATLLDQRPHLGKRRVPAANHAQSGQAHPVRPSPRWALSPRRFKVHEQVRARILDGASTYEARGPT